MKAERQTALDYGHAANGAPDRSLQNARRDRPRNEADTETCSAFRHAMAGSDDRGADRKLDQDTCRYKDKDKDTEQADGAAWRDLWLSDMTAAQPPIAQGPMPDPSGESDNASSGCTDDNRRVLVARLAQALNRGVDRLLVLDGQGAGLRAVRMSFDADLLPGATVQVAEIAGCMQATFNCTQQQSRRRLSAGIDALARQWARSLKRPVRVLLAGQDSDIFDEQAVQADPEQEP